MDASTIHTLKELNNAFYAANHESFSQTRNHPWEGWKRVLAAMGNRPSTVLDMACGNMRFKAFLENEVGSGVCEYHGVDSCPSLLPPDHGGSFQQLDLIDELVAGTLAQRLRAPECDLTVCFGFMHHIPSFDLRASMMRSLLEKTAPGGVVAVSFWQFALDEALRLRAEESTFEALGTLELNLGEDDYLIGWQGKPGVYRYCHSFTGGEVSKLAESCEGSAVLVDRFKSDGKDNRMNDYIVLRKRQRDNLYNRSGR